MTCWVGVLPQLVITVEGLFGLELGQNYLLIFVSETLITHHIEYQIVLITIFRSSLCHMTCWVGVLPQLVITVEGLFGLELGQTYLLIFVSETLITHEIEH